jgi:rRNA maturation protein Nop10
MMWVCPICWETFTLQETHCPKCGSDLAVVDRRRFDATTIEWCLPRSQSRPH